jgi:GcvH upstream region-like protein
MLDFFRRHQRFFFMFITVVIVISFSFFGTYSVYLKNEKKDGVAFTAIDGTKVYGGQLRDLVSLLGGDSRDLLLRSGAGTAFNDGFIAKDILATGVAQVLMEPILKNFQKEFTTRAEKEKHFVPFVHKMHSFINAEQVWTYFAPDVKKNYVLLKSFDNPLSPLAFDARVKLYLAERNFPAPYMRQVMRYQLSQFEDPSQDEELATRDLSIFGYHTLQDWFSKGFIEYVAQYVINVAKLAEQKGYSVSTQEVLASLSYNIQGSFKENRNNPYFNYSTQDLYFQEELRHQNMDLSRLVAAWKNVELYRRFMGQNKDALVISPLPFKDFARYLEDEVEAESFHLPKDLCFHTLYDLEKFELYLTAVRDPKEKLGALMLPTKFLPAEEVVKSFPELVEKRYRLRYWHCDKEVLKTKIGVRATWEWQLEDKGWKKLQEKFPDIGAKKVVGREDRCGVLDTLDAKARSLVDAFSRDCILDEHPEWIEEALAKSAPKEEDLFLRERGGKSPFVGIIRPGELFRLLDSAQLADLNPALSSYSQDGVHFWKIIVVDRQEAPKILTFREANGDGTLDKVLDKILETSYSRIRSSHPSAYVKENGEFKDFKEVKDLVGEAYFQDFFLKLDRQKEALEELAGIGKDASKNIQRLACRFLPYMKEALQAISEQSPKASEYISFGKKDIVQPLLDQWKLIKGKEKLVRKETGEAIFSPLLFSLDVGQYSKLCWMGNNGISFFKVIGRTKEYQGDLLARKVYESRELLQNEFTRTFARELSAKMREKGAFGSFSE